MKKSISILLSIIMVFAMCTMGFVTASADIAELPEKPEGTNRYYFYLPDEWLNESTEKTGDTAGIYWWDGTDAPDWPGYAANKADADGVYYYDVPVDVNTIIWNNFFDGGADESAPYYADAIQTLPIETERYVPDENDFYPEGTDSFDGMIYVVDFNLSEFDEYSGKLQFGGDWFYYYGNGEYGTSEVRGESEIFTEQVMNGGSWRPGGEYTTDDEEPVVETNRYYFYLPDEWLNEFAEATGSTAGIYWWDGTDAHDSWPGVPAKKADVEGVYYYDVPKDVTTIIWNNFVDGGSDSTQPQYYNALQTVNIGTEYYDPDESEFYPNGTEDFDGMIFVVDYSYFPYGDYTAKASYDGEWFYYYGNGEYGTAPKRGDSRVLSGDTASLDDVRKSNNAGDEWPSPSLAAYYWGDSNGDYSVNIKDATYIQKAVADLVVLSETEKLAADVNSDYNVNVKDATAIQKWIAGIDTGTHIDSFFGRFWIG